MNGNNLAFSLQPVRGVSLDYGWDCVISSMRVARRFSLTITKAQCWDETHMCIEDVKIITHQMEFYVLPLQLRPNFVDNQITLDFNLFLGDRIQ